MSIKSILLPLALGLMVLFVMPKPALAQSLAGRVYEGSTGTEPPTSSALANVTVKLYGSNDASNIGTFLTSTTTNSEGWYGLEIGGSWEYYNIIEQNPSGYNSEGATSVSGTVKSADWIQYDWNQLNGTLTGNKFWDKKQSVQNHPPVADADGPYTGKVNQPVQFDGSASYDPDSSDYIAKYEWDMDYDGQYDDATGVNPAWTWPSPAVTTIGLKVTDTHGAADTDSTIVTIEAEYFPCTAAFNADPRNGCAPLIVTFKDASSNAQSWIWKFPGGNPSASTQQNPTVTYQNPGQYSVALKIICQNGAVDSLYFSDYILVQDCNHDMDFGDAPDPTYPTLFASNGARHLFDPDIFLGTKIDAESDGQPNSDASGDDNDGNDDDDGVVFKKAFIPGNYATFDVTASRDGHLGVWVDFNGNGSFADPGESAFISDTVVFAGVNAWGISVPANAKPGKSFARFRYSTHHNLTISGLFDDGEVEDYQIVISDGQGTASVGDLVWNDFNHNGLQDAAEAGIANVTVTIYDANGSSITSIKTNSSGNYKFSGLPPGYYILGFTLPAGYIISPVNQGMDDAIDSDANPSTGKTVLLTLAAGEQNMCVDAGMYASGGPDQYDFGDSPDPAYPTVFASNGARHVVQKGFFLGSGIDAEPDGQPTALADGDNNSGANDEDGVQISPIITPGSAISVNVIASAPGALNAWLDFNLNGTWADAGEQIISAQPVAPGVNTFTINVPASAKVGQSYARFRLSSVRNISYDGPAPDGEVEDYAVAIQPGGRGNLTIIKDATPKDDTPFWISIVYGFMGGASPFLDPSSNKASIVDGPTGTYHIGESLPADWALADIIVNGDADNGSSIDVSNKIVDIDLDAGEKITVIFKNTKIGTEDRDFGDAPLPYPPASHLLGGPWEGGLGNKPDAEPGMQRDPNALGDDNDGNDDEDGLQVFNGFLVKGGVSNYVQLDCFTDASHNSLLNNLWIDFNGDGDWNDAGEDMSGNSLAFIVAPLSKYSTVWTFPTPANAIVGKTMARCRVWSDPGESASPSGPGSAGEVADYEIEIRSDGPGFPAGGIIFGYKWHDLNGNGVWDAAEPPLVGWTIWLDLNHNGVKDTSEPETQTDPFGRFLFSSLQTGTYNVHEVISGSWTQTFPGSPAFHIVTADPNKPSLGILFGNKSMGALDQLDYGDAPSAYSGFNIAGAANPSFTLGKIVDSEPAPLYDAHALGDDQNGADDEDGVVFLTPLLPGQAASVQVDLTNTNLPDPPQLYAWIDFNGDGDWSDTGEWVINQIVAGSSVETFSIPIPASATIGITCARFFLIDRGPLPPNGIPYGEVEDYEIEIGEGHRMAMKWVQPALINENANMPFTPYFMGWIEPSLEGEAIIADDWFCRDPRPVTDIHWQGSYVNWHADEPPENAPFAFRIGVWTNLPQAPEMPRGGPNTLIWQWEVPRSALNERVVGRHFYPESMVKPDSSFQYDFIIPQDEWFYQEGDSTIYWLSISAIYQQPPEQYIWGWLTRQLNFHGFATRIVVPKEYYIGSTAEKTEPVFDMWDMVFVLSTDEYKLEFDYGDAPAERYQTFMRQNGARHFVDPAIHLGERIDIDPDGQPEELASGDDNDGSDDDDGVLLKADLRPDQPAEIEITASTNGFLNAWIDFNNNGNWSDPNEQIFLAEPLKRGPNLRVFPVPADALAGRVYARFRFSREAYLPFFGLAIDGEVEDYAFNIVSVSVVQKGPQTAPIDFRLYQNHPNPFNSETTIPFDVKEICRVELSIYDVLGHEIQKLVNGYLRTGHHQAIFNASGLSSGIYYYHIKMGAFSKKMKMIYLR